MGLKRIRREKSYHSMSFSSSTKSLIECLAHFYKWNDKGQFVIDDSPLRHFISSELPPLNHPPSSSSFASPPNSSVVTIFFSQMIDVSVAIILKFKLRMRKKIPWNIFQPSRLKKSGTSGKLEICTCKNKRYFIWESALHRSMYFLLQLSSTTQ